MESQIIVEIIDKSSLSLIDLKNTVYSTLSDKSTRREQLTMDDVRCTLSFTKPDYVDTKDSDRYLYFIIEIGGDSG